MADGAERTRDDAKVVVPFDPVPTHVVGSFVGWDPGSGAIVQYAGGPGPLHAASVVVLDPVIVRQAIERGQGVLLAFDGGRADAPIVVGLLQDPKLVPPADVEVDGRRVVIEGRDEIVLRCGLASITLRSNGRVVIRGTYVETRSSGVNRIRGGSVQIN